MLVVLNNNSNTITDTNQSNLNMNNSNTTAGGFMRDRAYTTATSNPATIETSLTQQIFLQQQQQQLQQIEHLRLKQQQQQSHKLNFEFSIEDHIKKTKKAANFLKLLLHSNACEESNHSCGSISCSRTREMLRHTNTCYDSNCTLPGCMTTKKLWSHYRECYALNSTHTNTSNNTNATTHTTNNQARSSSASSNITASSTVASLFNKFNFFKSSETNITSNSNNVNTGSIPPTHFCLLCTLATSTDQSSRSPSVESCTYYTSAHICSHYSPDGEEQDHRLAPLISDEIIEFSRVPFQAFRNNSEEDGLVMMVSSSYGSSQGDESRKMRSKSMSAAISPSSTSSVLPALDLSGGDAMII